MMQATTKIINTSNTDTDMSVGEILRRTRLHYGQSFDDVERALNIRAHQVEALESGSYEKLPGPVYISGFLKTYANYLGLDSHKIVALYRDQTKSIPAQQVKRFSQRSKLKKQPKSSKALPLGIVFIALVLIVGIATGWWLSNSKLMTQNDNPVLDPAIQTERVNTKNETQSETDNDNLVPPAENTDQNSKQNNTRAEKADLTTIPTVQETLGRAEVLSNSVYTNENTQGDTAPSRLEARTALNSTENVSTAASTNTLDNNQSPINTNSSPTNIKANEKGIILAITQNTWVEIRDSTGQAIVSRVLQAGDKYFVPETPGLSMSLGNASGVEVEIDGRKLNTLGKSGEVKRGIELSTKSLKQKYGMQ